MGVLEDRFEDRCGGGVAFRTAVQLPARAR